MSQQITLEDALAAFRKKAADLADTNILLEARAAGLERDLAALREENERLKQDAPEAAPCGGPDLAATPPYTDGERA